MRIYADVARLGKRYLIVLPLLTPTIASIWVGGVTPIPGSLARPLIESLETDAVMRDQAIDSIIPPPEGGLTPYRDAVGLALKRAALGLADATWASLDSSPAEPVPNDPPWAGEIVYQTVRTAVTPIEPERVWKAVENLPIILGRYSFPLARRQAHSARWSADEQVATGTLRLRAATRAPRQAWLELRVTPRNGRGSRYEQRAIFFPRGLPGRVYWFLARPLHTWALRALVRKILRSAEYVTVTLPVPQRR